MVDDSSKRMLLSFNTVEVRSRSATGDLNAVNFVVSLMAYLRANKFLGNTFNFRCFLGDCSVEPGSTKDLEAACRDCNRELESVGKEMELDPSMVTVAVILWTVALVRFGSSLTTRGTVIKYSSNPKPVSESNLFCDLEDRECRRLS